MLKALELSGFKSFANRTRFEFPRGISVIVGPNGSGKSNLVDAVKWVLGSQSAKSLRGKEMTDVIFNGCATRTPLGTGEVTLTLDNDDGRLPLDAKEVHVTRRVYRSGEGEYLINRQPCRLRDIRDLLAGTGITTEAYCIIEQGKVDALLQSSPRDRRVIFEEAAGISQFKAKKATAMRRLERVEQNLLRLSDIVDEVESRLRSVRAQAGKARRYRETAERLEQLRTEIGLADWRTFTKQLAQREAQLEEVRRHCDEQARELEQSEAELAALEQSLEAGNRRAREIEGGAAAVRERIAARQATLENQRARHAQLQQDVERARRQLVSIVIGRENFDGPLSDGVPELQTAEAELAAAMARRREIGQQAEQSQVELDRARRHFAEINERLAECRRGIAQCESQLPALQSQLEKSTVLEQQNRAQLAKLSNERESQATKVARCAQEELVLQSQVESHQELLRAAEKRLTHVRGELTRADKQHRQFEARLTRCRERIAVLTELEQRLEGLDGGIQEVLRRAQEDPDGPLREVCGVVADLFHVDVDTAHLIEAALGERAQFVVVVSGARLLEWMQREPLGIAGRIGFLRLDTRFVTSVLDHVDLSAEPGVMGRADQFIESRAEYAGLVKRLLGRTWLVDRLSTALRLSQAAGRGLEFVTSDGELLSADGTLVIGPRLAAAGIMSRRSELRACHEQAGELETQMVHATATHARLDQERAEQEALVANSVTAFSELTGELAERRQQTVAGRSRLDEIARQHERIDAEVLERDRQLAALRTSLEATTHSLENFRTDAVRLESEVDAGREVVATCEHAQTESQRANVECQVLVAKAEQRIELFRHQQESARRNRLERDRTQAELRQRCDTQQADLAELDAQMLSGRQELAELFLRKERHAVDLAELAASYDAIRRERAQLGERIRLLRQQHTTTSSQLHKLESSVGRLRHERQTLCERMQDDYAIDLAEAAGRGEPAAEGEEHAARGTDPVQSGTGGISARSAPLPTAFNRDAVESEIAQLRDQINHIGAVNLEALDELDNLETRFSKLSGQYRDLVEAKASLERIIQRINTDSRQLFLMTLETVRGHFQGLFRRLFGGGEADIVVDEADDVLEGGIEIVARPPGKEACSISLLSGGEKTLTCVALLLAVFHSKPSPFCILDEVDAALDEANIGRFVSVLREFLSFTQFVVVTHSKKTMSGGDTLYGVTMEESGVSKRVSVRFEDVSEDGHIRPAALLKGGAATDSTARNAADDAVSRRAA